MSDDYDRSYAQIPELFGSAAEATLERFSQELDPGLPVLDIGGGLSSSNSRF